MLAETQSAVLPLVLYLDTLRWVFIAVVLGVRTPVRKSATVAAG